MSLIDALTNALTTVQDPELHRSITELGMVEELAEVNGDVSIKRRCKYQNFVNDFWLSNARSTSR
jgi:metal-sulfur cluster biosynthetic enzyme